MIDARTKWSYSIGATGRDMAYALVSMYLLNYIQYTMQLTVAQYSTISIIMVICLVWDAINDPLMGMIIENTHFKRGKFRPWIISGCLLNAIVIVLLFTIRPQGWGFVAFFGLSYLCWGMTYTMNDISYWGMLPSLTSDAKERNTLVTLMSIFICIGQFSVAGVIPMVVAGNAVNAYRIIGIVIAICFVLFQTLTYFGVKERPRLEKSDKKTLSLSDMFKIFERNDQLIAIGITSLLFTIENGLLLLFGMNFFYFEFGYAEGGGLIFIFTIMYALGTLGSQIVFPLFTKKFSRKQLINIMTILIVIGYIAFLLFGYVLPRNVVLLNIIGFSIFFCQGIYNLVILIMINNTIEYDEFKYFERHDSIISAVRSFTAKLGGAINQGIVALVLIISGIYSISQKITGLEVEVGKGNMTSEQVLSQAQVFISGTLPWQKLALRIGIVAIPIIMILICHLIIRKKYIIDELTYNKMVLEIEKRKENK